MLAFKSIPQIISFLGVFAALKQVGWGETKQGKSVT